MFCVTEFVHSCRVSWEYNLTRILYVILLHIWLDNVEEENEDEALQEEAAIVIESAFRCFLARRLRAAKKIQAFVRKQKHVRAAKKIQAFVRKQQSRVNLLAWAEILSRDKPNTDEQARALLLQDEADAEAQADKIMRALALADTRLSLSPPAEETKDDEGEYIMCSVYWIC